MNCSVITNCATSLNDALTPDQSALEQAVQDIWTSIEENITTGVSEDEVYDIANNAISELDIYDHSHTIEDIVREVISSDPELYTEAIKLALPSILGDQLSGPGQEEHDSVKLARDEHYKRSDWKGVVLYRCRTTLESIAIDIQEWLDGGTTDLAHSNVIEVMERIKCVVDALENTETNISSDLTDKDGFDRLAVLKERLEWKAAPEAS